MERCLNLLGKNIELLLAHHARLANCALDSTLVAHGLDNIASASLTLGADESSTLRDTTESFTEVSCTADKGHFEVVLVDVELIIGRSQYLGLIDVIDTDLLDNLQENESERPSFSRGKTIYLRLNKVADADLGHHRDSNGINDFLDHLGVAL